MTHVEDVPELAKRQRQKRHRHRRLLIQFESEARKDKGSKCRDRQCSTVQYDCEPLAAAENRLLRIARWPLQYILVAFAHGEGKSRKDVRYEVQKQYLQWKKRQWQSGDHRTADDQNLGQIAGQQVSRESADIAKDDSSVPDRLNDCREGVVQQDHRSRFSRNIGAPKSHGHADIRLS